jgi:hypothetical protein
VRASGNTLDRDDRESVNAFGETFRYNLDRNLESTDFQMGLDLSRTGKVLFAQLPKARLRSPAQIRNRP